jgi:GAF domain-containing protein
MVNPTPSSDTTDSPDPSQAFDELADLVVDDRPSEQRLRRIVELAKQTFGGVEDVSLTVVEDGRPRSVVFTGPLAIHLDHHQYEAGFGPCLDAAKTGQTIVLDSQHDDSPYQEFTHTADRAGVRHVVSVEMPLAQRTIGSLNIYRTATAPLSTAALQQAEVFANHAAVTIANVTSYANATHPSAR